MPRNGKQDPVWRKKRAKIYKESPLPVPVASVSSGLPTQQSWYHYTGYLQGSCVIIRHSGDVDFLYRMGFFGKGSLSRSEPTFVSRLPKVNIPCSIKIKSSEPDCANSSTNSVQGAVMTKRNYLKHLEYRALEEDDESGYNELTEQEGMQRFKNEEEEEEELDDEEEEEEEESYESDSSGPLRFASMKRNSYYNEIHSAEDLSIDDQPTSVLVSLLSQVAQLSKENIATFVKGPHTLRQLEKKFEKIRMQQMTLVNGGSDAKSSVSKPSRKATKSNSQDVIDLRDMEEGDDVIVLNSNENSRDSEDQDKDDSKKTEKTSKRCDQDKDDSNETEKTSKSWDDPNNEGDATFWGMEASVGKKRDDKQEGDQQDLSESDEKLVIRNSAPSPANCSGDNDSEKSECKSADDSKYEKNDDDNEAGTQKTEEETKKCNKESVRDKKIDESDEVEDMRVDPSSDASNDLTLDKSKENHAKEMEDENIHGHSSSEETAVSIKSAKCHEELSSSKISVLGESKEDGDSNDSDDVICVEAQSAEPAKLHNFLSQSARQKQSSSLISKMVRFMTNIAKEPKFVNAKVGFRSWTNVLHFNFSGDAAHLPTSLEVLPDEEKKGSHDVAADSVGSGVYERVYPPVGSLVTNPHSKGVVIKQRLEEIPYLDIAKRNVLGSTTKLFNPSHSSYTQLPSSQLSLPPRKRQPHHDVSSLSYQKKTLYSKLTAMHQKSDLLDSEKKEISSLLPCHLTQYICVFQQDKFSSVKDDVDEDLLTFFKEFDKIKDLSLTSHSSDTGKSDSASKDNQLLKRNCLVSEYLSKIGISLIKELILLKILVCGSEIDCQIPKDVITETKAGLLPQENNSLLERLDFVQSCLTSYKKSSSVLDILGKKKNNSEDVIMIDLSDEESNDRPETSDLSKQTLTNASAQSNSPAKRGDSDLSEGAPSENDPDGMDTSTPLEQACVTANKGNESKLDGAVSFGGKRLLPKESEDDERETNGKKAKINDGCQSDIVEGKENGVLSSSTDVSHKVEKSSDSSNQQPHGDSQQDETSVLKPTTSKGGCGQSIDDDGSDVAKDISAETEEPCSSELTCLNGSVVNKDTSLSNSHPTNQADEQCSKTQVDGGGEVGDSDVRLSNAASETAKSNDSSSHDEAKEISPADVSLAENQIYIGSSDDDDEEEGDYNGKKSKPHVQTLEHPYSVKDDLTGSLFIIPNTSDEEDEELTTAKSSSAGRFIWQPCIKKDPFPSTEHLQLLLEEAFFLTFGLGCLTVLDPEKNPMTITDMWQQFPLLKDNFVPHYVAYHYFRSKGWVPKSGLKFGCDFVLYREGPPFFHGSYSVVVVAVDEDSLTPMIGEQGGLDYAQRLNTWITLSGLNRVTEHVAKELMYCYVICPKNMTEAESRSPTCLSRYRVKEVVVSRWVSSKERENRDTEEVP